MSHLADLDAVALRMMVLYLEKQNRTLSEEIGALKAEKRKADERYDNRTLPCGCRMGWCDCAG